MNEAEVRKIDFAIIGAGATGLSAGAYAARGGMDTTIFEQMAPGGQLMIIDSIENYPGLSEPISGFDLASKFEAMALGFGAKIEYAEVSSLRKCEDGFYIGTAMGDFISKAVLLATGATHRSLGVPGEKEYSGKGVSYCATCDGPFFKGKKILVVGGGDSAVQETLYLSKLSDKVTIIHRRDRFRAQKQIVTRLENNPSVTIRLNTTLKEIKGDQWKVTSVVLEDALSHQQTEEAFDAVFGFVGIIPQTALAAELNLKLDEAGYVITDQDMATSMPGVFAGGDVRSTPFRQVVTGCSDGAVAAHKAQEYIDDISGNSYGVFRS